jgi:hypothetical protein
VIVLRYPHADHQTKREDYDAVVLNPDRTQYEIDQYLEEIDAIGLFGDGLFLAHVAIKA